MTRIKVCGMTRQQDVDACIQNGVDYTGFIFTPKSPRYITPQAAARLDTGELLRVGVFVNQSLEEVQEMASLARLDLLQLHGGESAAMAEALGAERVIKVLWPEKCSVQQLQEQMQQYAPYVAYFLLDAGNGGGGHGLSLAWESLVSLRPPRPYFLAGGLGADNVGSAVRLLQPYAVDMNSALEDASGKKSGDKIAQAVRAVR